jgi:hypothetical protein
MYLRELGIALGKQRDLMSADDMAHEIEAINRANWSPGITCGRSWPADSRRTRS